MANVTPTPANPLRAAEDVLDALRRAEQTVQNAKAAVIEAEWEAAKLENAAKDALIRAGLMHCLKIDLRALRNFIRIAGE